MKFIAAILIGMQIYIGYSSQISHYYIDPKSDNNGDLNTNKAMQPTTTTKTITTTTTTTTTTITTTTITITTTTSDMPIGDLIKEIKSNKNLSKEILCPKYKDRIVKHCQKMYDDNVIGPYDQDRIDNFIGDDSIMSQICSQFNYVYMKCLITFLNSICLPIEFASLYEENIGIQTMCESYYYELILIEAENKRKKFAHD